MLVSHLFCSSYFCTKIGHSYSYETKHKHHQTLLYKFPQYPTARVAWSVFGLFFCHTEWDELTNVCSWVTGKCWAVLVYEASQLSLKSSNSNTMMYTHHSRSVSILKECLRCSYKAEMAYETWASMLRELVPQTPSIFSPTEPCFSIPWHNSRKKLNK